MGRYYTMDDSNHISLKKLVLPLKDSKVLKKLGSFNKGTIHKFNSKKILLGLMIAVILGLLFATYKINEIRTRAHVVYYGDKEVGIVRDKEEAERVLETIKEELTSTYNIDVVLCSDISFEDTHAKDDLIVSADQLKANIKSKMTFLITGYALIVDGNEIGYVRTKEDGEEIIAKIMEPYLDMAAENDDIKEVKIVEDVKIEKRDIPLNKLNNKDELLQYIQTGGEEIKVHIVEVGESLWTISKMYDMSVDDLIAANPDKEPEKLQIGDEIKLVVSKPLITVETVEEVRYTEKTKYEVNVEYSDKMYKTEQKVKVKGSEGENEYLAKIVKHNGVVVEKEILEEKVIKEPVHELVVKGTKELPKTTATGAFLMPTRGVISSRYGMRNGRMHKGLDIAASVGTDIKAADGGKVTYVGRRGAYGNLVEIDHGNGYKTRYAHCSKILVKKGDKVYKGQVIAKVGNTGRSTGPHLHFEIIKNGRNVNPLSYVK